MNISILLRGGCPPFFMAKLLNGSFFWPLFLSLIIHLCWLLSDPLLLKNRKNHNLNFLPVSISVFNTDDKKERADQIISKPLLFVTLKSEFKLNVEPDISFELSQQEQQDVSHLDYVDGDFFNQIKPSNDIKKRPFSSGRQASANDFDYEQKKNMAISGQFFNNQNKNIRASQIYQREKEIFLLEIQQILNRIDVKNFECTLADQKKCAGLPDPLVKFIYKKWDAIWQLNGFEKISFGSVDGKLFFNIAGIR